MRRRHPWIFSGAVADVDGGVGAGDTVTVLDHAGAALAQGYYSSGSQIRVRVLDWHAGAAIDDGWWRGKVLAAVARRADLPCLETTNLMRLVHGEADGLPGLIIDRYGDFAVFQALTAGVDRVKQTIADTLLGIDGVKGVFERSDSDVRGQEGLKAVTGLAAGDEPPEVIEVFEGDVRYMVDVRRGHKTGLYVDQRENRPRVAAYARGRSVLDLFSYSGGFAIHALEKDASRVTLADSSADSLALAERNLHLSGVESDRYELVQANVFDLLRSFRDSQKTFDMVILDPPKFAQTRTQLEKAERAYKDVNLIAMKLLKPGGILATFSCSGAVAGDAFLRFVSWAALDAERNVQVLERLAQPADHPISPTFPESEYLKGLVCRVD